MCVLEILLKNCNNLVGIIFTLNINYHTYLGDVSNS